MRRTVRCFLDVLNVSRCTVWSNVCVSVFTVSEDDTRRLIELRAANESLFTGRRNTAKPAWRWRSAQLRSELKNTAWPFRNKSVCVCVQGNSEGDGSDGEDNTWPGCQEVGQPEDQIQGEHVQQQHVWLPLAVSTTCFLSVHTASRLVRCIRSTHNCFWLCSLAWFYKKHQICGIYLFIFCNLFSNERKSKTGKWRFYC